MFTTFRRDNHRIKERLSLVKYLQRSVGLAFLLGVSSFNALADNSEIAFVWANQESSPAYTPQSLYTLASNPVRIARTAAGQYRVELGSIVRFRGGRGGHVQVSAYGFSANRCKVNNWTGSNVFVNCFDVAGSFSDTKFTLLFNRASAITEDVAYVWADRPASASYAPSEGYSHGLDPINITRSDTGEYTVDLGTIAAQFDGNAQVTSYGSGSSYCNVVSWGFGEIDVVCYDNTGLPIDSRFTLLFSRVSDVQDNIAYAWANQASTASYTPSSSYSYSNDPIAITRSAPGTYAVDLGSVASLYANVQVTAYGATSNSCVVRNWSGGVANIDCYDVSGNSVDQRFTILARNSGVSDTRSEVDIVSSCLAGAGRVDLNIVNSVTALSTYRLEFQGLSARERTVAFEDWGRIRISGRPSGTYTVVAKRDGVTILDKEITINCSATAPPVGTPQVRILNACRATGGYVLFQMINPTNATRPYVIEFEGVPNRSTSATAFGQAVRATTGRPDGTYNYRVRTGSSTVNRGELTVDCS